MECLLVTTLLIALGATADSARILAFFPMPSPSHHFFFQPILFELARRGHEIDYYSPFPMANPHENITHVQLENFMQDVIESTDLFNHWKIPIQEQIVRIWDAAVLFSRETSRIQPVQELLASQSRYDVFLHENMFVAESFSVFQHKFNATSVTLLAIGDHFNANEMSGLVTNPAFMVHSFAIYSDRMNFWQRLHNSYLMANTLFRYYAYLRAAQQVIDECYTYDNWESRPDLKDLVSDQALILVNRHHSVGYAFPQPPHMKDVGGAVVLPRKPLPKDLEKFINEAKDGIIYFSLGSLFDMNVAMPHLKDIFAQAFAERKERVLWKWNGEPWKGLPSNIKLSKWFPQQDILAHKNTKLFITHGGLQSSFETVHFAVPVIAIPGFADQLKNALALAQHGYGVLLSLDNITDSSLKWAITETLENPRYKQKVLKGSEILKDRPVSPVDEAAYWIEYVIRHGNVLQPAGAKLGHIRLHLWDILTFIFVVLLASFCVIKKVLVFTVNKLTKSSRKSVSNKKKQS